MKMSAAALDSMLSVIPAEADAEISIVVSHKGQVEDALVIGNHEIGELLSVVAHVDRAQCEILDVTATSTTLLGLSDEGSIQ